MEKRFAIPSHPDIELGFNRNELEYFITFPHKPVDSGTGLIMVISGFGDRADSPYQKEKLRPYLADKYNCLAVGVNYFGISVKSPRKGFNYITDEHFPDNIQAAYGIEPGAYILSGVLKTDVLADMLKQRGIRRLDAVCRLVRTYLDGEYQSFGFLPAIDCMTVVGDILKRNKIDKKKIMAFGSSYGGYIALLLGKFAHKTFSLIVDNSGFINTSLANIAGKEFVSEESLLINGVAFPFVEDSPWTVIDETAPNYFSDGHRSIRNLIAKEHMKETETSYYIFHSQQDQIIKIAEKDRLVDLLKSKSKHVYYKRVSSADIDGRLFKNLDHGMSASLRGIFDCAAGAEKNIMSKLSEETDFDLGSSYLFSCGRSFYKFRFGTDFGLTVESELNNY